MSWSSTSTRAPNPKLTAVDASMLADVLMGEARQQLEALWITNSEIGNEGAAPVADSCRLFVAAHERSLLPALKSATLVHRASPTPLPLGRIPSVGPTISSFSDIGDAGIVALGAAFEKAAAPPVAAVAHLHNNRIGDDGVKALMAAAQAMMLYGLEDFSLENNEFGLAAVEALADAIINDTLPYLKLLFINRDHRQHSGLKAACRIRGIRWERFGEGFVSIEQQAANLWGTLWHQAAGGVSWHAIS